MKYKEKRGYIYVIFYSLYCFLVNADFMSLYMMAVEHGNPFLVDPRDPAIVTVYCILYDQFSLSLGTI